VRKTATALAIAGVALAGTLAALAMRALPETASVPAGEASLHPVFTEVNWPFPIDQWGTGRAFVCAAADCGTRVMVYVRPKIGFCNCATGVSDDPELERVSDTDLVARQVNPLSPGRPVKVGWMEGRVRTYAAADAKSPSRLVSIAFNDECDVVVGLAELGASDPALVAPAVVEFLQSRPMVLWAKKELGLEFVKREW
jgi:hypothetical protein